MNEPSAASAREYSVVYDNGHRVPLRDREDAERMRQMTRRGRVEWRTTWRPLDHKDGCECLICDPDEVPDA